MEKNNTKRFPVMFLLDTSEKEEGARREESLNRSLQKFKKHLSETDCPPGLEFCMYTLSEAMHEELMEEDRFVPAQEFQPPTVKLDGQPYLNTALVNAMTRLVIQELVYQESNIPCRRPVLILLSDGRKEDDSLTEETVSGMRKVIGDRLISFFAVAIGKDADESALRCYFPENEAFHIPHFAEETDIEDAFSAILEAVLFSYPLLPLQEELTDMPPVPEDLLIEI